ncbi:hypothetical protein TNCV_2310321 [Trichonephila clavipes]|nr:hypothetical protein TNCV_2310321 [Trichonephila clavipes]
MPVLTGLSSVLSIPQAQHGCKPPLDSSCTAVSTSSTTVQLTLFSLYYIAREKNVSLQIFESFFPGPRSMPIFIPLSVQNFSRAIGAQSLFL